MLRTMAIRMTCPTDDPAMQPGVKGRYLPSAYQVLMKCLSSEPRGSEAANGGLKPPWLEVLMMSLS